MKKLLFLILLIFITANFLSCGGGGGGGSSSSPKGTVGKTQVVINLGQTKTVSSSGRLLRSTQSIPAAIESIKFTITAPDMATIVRVITVAGRASISETFEIPSGPNRHFVIEALDASGNILYRGDLYADLTGTSADLTIAMISVEMSAPVFSGIRDAGSITTTSMVIGWNPATDNITPPERIQYLIYISTTPGGQDFTNPNFVTDPGATSFTITGLNPNTTYYIVVRAKDERGNVDNNTVEKSYSTIKPADITPPAFGGIVSATATSSTEINLAWNPATDNDTASGDIVYLVYISTTSGGQNLSIPNFTVTGSTSLTVTGLSPNTTYYFIIRAKDKSGNIDQNTVEKSARTQLPPAPPPPPTFSVFPSSGIICENTNSCGAGETITLNFFNGTPPYNITSSLPTIIPNAAGIAGASYVVDATDHSIMGGPGTTNVTLTVTDSLGANTSATVSVTNEQWYVDAVGGNDALPGDGTQTNPFKTITRTITAVAGRTGDFIYTLPGTYDLTNGETFPLDFGAATSITLDCGGATVSSVTSGQPAIFGGPNLSIRNCTITGDVSSSAILDNSSVITVDNCTVDGGLNGIELSTNSTVQNSMIQNLSNFGISVNLGNPVINNNTVQNGGNIGIIMGGNSSPAITNNSITSNSNHGIAIISNTGTPSITGNTISNNFTAGINIGGVTAGTTPNIASNNIFGNNTGIWIQINSTPTITGNTIQGNVEGINSSGGASPNISSNQIYSNVESGGIILDNSNATINNNQIYDNGPVGISLWNNSNAVITNNTIYSTISFNQQEGISVNSSLPTINGNSIYCNSGADLYVSSSGASINATNNKWDHDAGTPIPGPTVVNVYLSPCVAGTDICYSDPPDLEPTYSPFNTAVAGGCL